MRKSVHDALEGPKKLMEFYTAWSDRPPPFAENRKLKEPRERNRMPSPEQIK